MKIKYRIRKLRKEDRNKWSFEVERKTSEQLNWSSRQLRSGVTFVEMIDTLIDVYVFHQEPKVEF